MKPKFSHVMRPSFFFVATGLTLLSAVTEPSAQPLNLIPRQAAGSGCTVQVDNAMLQSAGPETRLVVLWDGPCVGGSARGLGTLSVEGVSGAYKWQTSFRQTTLGGLPFGYRSLSSFMNSIKFDAVPGYRFVHDGTELVFSEGWGLSLQGVGVGASVVKVPEAAPVNTFLNQVIGNGLKTLMLMESNCLIHQALPVCTGKGNSQFFAIVEFDDTRPAATRFSTRRTIPCPDPQNITSCVSLVNQLGAPLVRDIVAFIQRAKPDVEDMLRRMAAPVTVDAGQPAPAAPLATTPGVSRPMAEAAPPQRESSPNPSSIDLERLPVGALFSAADEAAAKGDKAAARSALRALIRRFPDHPLAATAAKQLSALR